MTGEKDITILIRSMKPELKGGPYVFCSVPHEQIETMLKYRPMLIFHEDEGSTVILEKQQADKAAFIYKLEWALITLKIHSALDAVGFLARITKALADVEISVNAVSAYYHDHLFVPFDRKEDAMQALKTLAEKG